MEVIALKIMGTAFLVFSIMWIAGNCFNLKKQIQYFVEFTGFLGILITFLSAIAWIWL